jgi:hypothetical protein
MKEMLSGGRVDDLLGGGIRLMSLSIASHNFIAVVAFQLFRLCFLFFHVTFHP